MTTRLIGSTHPMLAALALLIAQGCGSTPATTADAGQAGDVPTVDTPASPIDVHEVPAG